jgi:hypothetical protein
MSRRQTWTCPGGSATVGFAQDVGRAGPLAFDVEGSASAIQPSTASRARPSRWRATSGTDAAQSSLQCGCSVARLESVSRSDPSGAIEKRVGPYQWRFKTRIGEKPSNVEEP